MWWSSDQQFDWHRWQLHGHAAGLAENAAGDADARVAWSLVYRGQSGLQLRGSWTWQVARDQGAIAAWVKH